MKKLVLVIFSMFLFAGVLSAQHVAADGGKTYYDEAKTKLKEKKLLLAERKNELIKTLIYFIPLFFIHVKQESQAHYINHNRYYF